MSASTIARGVLESWLLTLIALSGLPETITRYHQNTGLTTREAKLSRT